LSSLRSNVIATVVGGVILAALGKLAGFAPQAWDLVARLSMGVWSWLIAVSTFSLPNGLWAMLAVAIVVVSRTLRRGPSTAPPVPVYEAPSQLDQSENAVMKLLAARHGVSITPGDLARQVDLQPLRASKVVEALETRGFVRLVENYIHGPSVHLTDRGRDYLLEQGFVD
jgi:DNA-binding MarR family transcriptional regulator